VAQARALQAEAASGTQGRTLAAAVRDLQTEWQQQAKAVPLPRGSEAALWQQFRSALDAAFDAHKAALRAHDETRAAAQAERSALIARLEALAGPAPADAATLARTVSEVDAQWQAAAAPPRPVAAALEARYRAARAAAQAQQARGVQDQWQAACAGLQQGLARCARLQARLAAQDAAAGAPAAAPTAADAPADEAPWAPPPHLPAAWAQALGRRLAALEQALAAGSPEAAQRLARTADPEALRATLLALEVALDLASPPEEQGARRALKLGAMKAALEERRAATAGPGVATLMSTALGEIAADAAQGARLQAIVAALATRPPPAGRG
jgi:hypothetical protein